MIFLPNEEEQNRINMIRDIRGGDYNLIRLTPTMINKNNIDANGLFRSMLLNSGFVDYEKLERGGCNGISTRAKFIKETNEVDVLFKFYRVTNSRGDRRFSIETIKRKWREKEINEGDLLYISVFYDLEEEPHLFMVNLTTNFPDINRIINIVGRDDISKKYEEIKPVLAEIINGGWYKNSKGKGAKAPKDVGDTLESLLSVATNNDPGADIDGLIEIKSKGESNTLDTLFTLRPRFDGTPIEAIEPKDRNRVSAFARYYGYESDKHPNCNSLYITIGSENAPQNNQGFYLDVDEENYRVNLIKKSDEKEIAAFWTFEDLKTQLELKHPSTLWVRADEKTEDDIVYFRYTEIEFSRSPQFMTFLALIKSGAITYDWRGYTTKTGDYKGKNHGNAWRIKPKAKGDLFGEIKIVNVNDL